MKNAAIILTLVATIVFSLSDVHDAIGQIDQMGALPPSVNQNDRSDCDETAEIDLYIKPEPIPDPDGQLTETQKKVKASHPELFATEAVIVTFGAPWCRWCKAQVRELRGPSLTYNVLVYDIEAADDEKTEEEKNRAKENLILLDLYELGRTIPITVVIEKGVVVKTFYGFTPWGEIAPHAEKAKKNDKQKTHIDIGPIHIDWDDGGIDIDRNKRDKRKH